MSDLFHEKVTDEYIVKVARVMQTANWHTFQLLTKRSERLRNLLNGKLAFAANLAHIWWGVSVEDRSYGVPRIDHLRQTPARIKFLSIEPLLEDLGTIALDDMDWVIVGGESGPGARPMDAVWVESILDQCHKARVPFFFKQWGGVQKKRNGRMLNGRTYDEFPVTAIVEMPDRWARAQCAQELERRLTSLACLGT